MTVDHLHLELVDGHKGIITTWLDLWGNSQICIKVDGLQCYLISFEVDLAHQREIEDSWVFLTTL